MESVREMESGQVRLGGSSTPGGRGPSALDCGAGAGAGGWPFMAGGGLSLGGALSPEPLSFDQSTLSFLPIIS